MQHHDKDCFLHLLWSRCLLLDQDFPWNSFLWELLRKYFIIKFEVRAGCDFTFLKILIHSRVFQFPCSSMTWFLGVESLWSCCFVWRSFFFFLFPFCSYFNFLISFSTLLIYLGSFEDGHCIFIHSKIRALIHSYDVIFLTILLPLISRMGYLLVISLFNFILLSFLLQFFGFWNLEYDWFEPKWV